MDDWTLEEDQAAEFWGAVLPDDGNGDVIDPERFGPVEPDET